MKLLRYLVAVILFAVFCGIAGPPIVHWIHGLWWPESGEGYAFMSSAGGCSFIGAGFGSNVMLWWHTHNCHTHGCPKIGRHHLAGGKYVICSSCLKKGGSVPEKITLEHIHDAHREHMDAISPS